MIAAEIGIDMCRFSTGDISSPGPASVQETARAKAKRRSSRMRKGAPWLETALIQCAWAAARKKGSYFRPNSIDRAPAAAPRRPSPPPPLLPCSPLPITCRKMEPSVKPSARTTSTAEPSSRKPSVSLDASRASAIPSRPRQWRRDQASVPSGHLGAYFLL
ncbi:MAG: hypothetical protein ACT4O2_09275 [Beijerinckiaceae bacterium]